MDFLLHFLSCAIPTMVLCCRLHNWNIHMHFLSKMINYPSQKCTEIQNLVLCVYLELLIHWTLVLWIFWKLPTHLPLLYLLELVTKLHILYVFRDYFFILISRLFILCLFADPEVLTLACSCSHELFCCWWSVYFSLFSLSLRYPEKDSIHFLVL